MRDASAAQGNAAPAIGLAYKNWRQECRVPVCLYWLHQERKRFTLSFQMELNQVKHSHKTSYGNSTLRHRISNPSEHRPGAELRLPEAALAQGRAAAPPGSHRDHNILMAQPALTSHPAPPLASKSHPWRRSRPGWMWFCAT